jgi:DNA mismatch repair protein MutL
MGKIVVLDDLTINQIAAGEVIERPASVVKELVENSIDAGATNITIEVKNGGIKEIKIIDNGSGINEDDIEFAFERHATSKIRKADDLQTVKSMGFRGEALASIAAISSIKTVTKTADELMGRQIVVEGGEVKEIEEIGAQTGTTITVNNLFYNTPVRYKFLKKDYTELGYIEDAVTRIALANPNVAIKLSNENKMIIQTTGNGDLKTIIYNIYGKEMTDGLIEVDYQYEDIIVKGFVGKPEIARGNRTNQIFFINKRYIKDKTLSAGTEQAFKGLLPIGKYGVLVLNLEIDPKKIDVNVHPTKLEIRFQEEQKVFKAVYHSIREALLKGDLVRNPEKEEIPVVSATPETEMEDKQEDIKISTFENTENISNLVNNEEVTTPSNLEEKKKTKSLGLFSMLKKKNVEEEVENNAIQEIYSNRHLDFEPVKTIDNKTVASHSYEEEIKTDIPISVLREQAGDFKTDTIVLDEEKEDFNKMYNETFGVQIQNKKEDALVVENYSFADSKNFANRPNISMFEEEEKIPNYKYCGAVFSTYIIIEMKNEMYIIDQHAAHERIMYENIKKNFYSDLEKESQIMLLPDIITLSHKEKQIVKENKDLFKKAGFIIEEFGENTIRLIGVPAICMQLDTKELFLEILDTIDTVAITAKQEKEDKFIATIACKAAVKANMNLTKEEVDSLMKKLLVLPNPFTCPHGRPTAIKMDKMDLERKFSRRK